MIHIGLNVIIIDHQTRHFFLKKKNFLVYLGSMLRSQLVLLQTQFFTLWVFVLILLAPISTLYINVTFLSTIVLIVGCFLSFIYPGYYILSTGEIVDGWPRFLIVDIFMHFLPWLVITRYQGLLPITEKWQGTLLFLLIYSMFYPPWQISSVYHVSFPWLVLLVCIASAIYCRLTKKKK